jgi:antitoxin MazE
MKTKVQKWGNSLAVRIPKTFADMLNFEHNTEVEVVVENDEVIIRPVKRYSLEQLLAEVSDENLHSEVETGTAVGNEIW